MITREPMSPRHRSIVTTQLIEAMAVLDSVSQVATVGIERARDRTDAEKDEMGLDESLSTNAAVLRMIHTMRRFIDTIEQAIDAGVFGDE